MSFVRDAFQKASGASRFDVCPSYYANLGICSAKGEVFFRVTEGDAVLFQNHLENVIVLDAGILAAILLRDPQARTNGMNMLAVGTGATGSLLAPDAPDPRQRKLNAEIARKPFSATTFRDAGGNAVAVPTNIVDFTCTFEEGEAVGPLTEMGILSTISSNPLVTNPNPNSFPTRDTTLDLNTLDVLINYLSFGCLALPATARLGITWRITF